VGTIKAELATQRVTA